MLLIFNIIFSYFKYIWTLGFICSWFILFDVIFFNSPSEYSAFCSSGKALCELCPSFLLHLPFDCLELILSSHKSLEYLIFSTFPPFFISFFRHVCFWRLHTFFYSFPSSFLLSILTCLCSFPLSSAASPLLCPSEFLHFRKWDTLIQYTDSWVTGKRTNEIKRHKSEKQEKPLMSLISCCVYSWLVCIFNTYFLFFGLSVI